MAAVEPLASISLPVAEPAAQSEIEQPAAPAATPAVITTPAVEADRAERSETASSDVDQRELDCLTRVMLYEAGAEGRSGQLAVAHVVLNRVRSPRFPDSVCSVIYQRGQFSSFRSFNPARNARWQRAAALARDVLEGETSSNVGSALYFHATRVRPAYVQSRVRVAQVGNHVFYR